MNWQQEMILEFLKENDGWDGGKAEDDVVASYMEMFRTELTKEQRTEVRKSYHLWLKEDTASRAEHTRYIVAWNKEQMPSYLYDYCTIVATYPKVVIIAVYNGTSSEFSANYQAQRLASGMLLCWSEGCPTGVHRNLEAAQELGRRVSAF